MLFVIQCTCRTQENYIETREGVIPYMLFGVMYWVCLEYTDYKMIRG